MWWVVHPGTSSCGTCPTSGATSKRQAGLAAATRRAARSGTRRSFSPWSSRTGRYAGVVDAAQPQDGERLTVGGEHAAALHDHPPHCRHGIQREHRGDQRVGTSQRPDGQRGVHEHQPGHQVRPLPGREEGDEAAHGVADETTGCPRDIVHGVVEVGPQRPWDAGTRSRPIGVQRRGGHGVTSREPGTGGRQVVRCAAPILAPSRAPRGVIPPTQRQPVPPPTGQLPGTLEALRLG
jgi:hypothetical protein